MFIIHYIMKDNLYNLRKKVRYVIGLLNFMSACYLLWFVLRRSHRLGSFLKPFLNFLRSLFCHLENTTVKILHLGPSQKRNTGMNELRLKKKKKKICFLRCDKRCTCSEGDIFLLEMCFLTSGFQI